MAYQYNIPLATDQLSKSQGDIQGNFNVLGAIAGNASGAQSSSINGTAGFNFLYLASQAGSIPPITFPAGNIGIYSATYPTSTLNELYLNKQNAGPTAVQVPFTASILSSNATPASPSNGYTYLPSGILLKWGSANATNNTATTITMPGAPIPSFTAAPFNIQLTFSGNNASHTGGIFLQSIDSATQFTVRSDAGNTKLFYWFAIGY